MKVFAKDVMQANVKSVRRDLPMADLERRFVDEKVSGFPVVDEDGTVQGVVSARDILKHVCKEREEIEGSTAFYEEDTQVEFASIESDWVSAEVGKRADHLTAGDLMTESVISVTPDTSLHDLAALMSKKKVHRVLVIDSKELLGIVTSADVVRACGNDGIDITFTPPEILDF